MITYFDVGALDPPDVPDQLLLDQDDESSSNELHRQVLASQTAHLFAPEQNILRPLAAFRKSLKYECFPHAPTDQLESNCSLLLLRVSLKNLLRRKLDDLLEGNGVNVGSTAISMLLGGYQSRTLERLQWLAMARLA